MKFLVRGETVIRWELPIEAPTDAQATFDALELAELGLAGDGPQATYLGQESCVTSVREAANSERQDG